MKYLKVPYTDQYDSFSYVYIPIDKITAWYDYYIYIMGESYYVRTDWNAEEIEKAIKEVEESNSISDKSIEKLNVEGATSIENGHSQENENEDKEEEWEMRINGIPVELQIGELKEVWKNVTVEILEMPDGEISIGWYRQEDTEQIV